MYDNTNKLNIFIKATAPFEIVSICLKSTVTIQLRAGANEEININAPSLKDPLM